MRKSDAAKAGRNGAGGLTLGQATAVVFAVTFLSFALSPRVQAQGGQNPGAVFLEIWPAARPTALAGAFAATADDPSATYYNQGGLGFMTGNHATLMHCNWLPGLYPGMYYEFGGFTHQFPNKGTLGVSAIYLTTGKTDVIDMNGNNLGSYTTFDFSTMASYGFQMTPQIGAGVGVKFIYSFLVPDWVFKAMPELGIDNGGSGTTWAVDAGALYKPSSRLSVGLSVANLGPNIAYTSSGESDPLPRTLRLGLRYSPVHNDLVRVSVLPEVTQILVGMFYDPENKKTLGQEIRYEFDESWKHFGVEACYYNFLFARVGYFEDITGARGGIVVDRGDGLTDHISLIKFLTTKNPGTFKSLGLTYGGGLQWGGFNFDISFDNMIYDFPTNNMKLSFSYRF
ncbi:MAG: PorV/PorQ family protein [candidate division WOR-3 bacterium]